MSAMQPNPIVDEFMPVAEKMLAEGKSQADIERAFRNHMCLRQKHFYRSTSGNTGIKRLGEAIFKDDGLFNKTLKGKNSADSTAERIFYDMLIENEIEFVFQREIGKYRVDFLVDGFLVVEIDGPLHAERKDYDAKRDRYLSSMGYKIYRVPVQHLAHLPGEIIENIKKGIRKYRKP